MPFDDIDTGNMHTVEKFIGQCRRDMCLTYLSIRYMLIKEKSLLLFALILSR